MNDRNAVFLACSLTALALSYLVVLNMLEAHSADRNHSAVLRKNAALEACFALLTGFVAFALLPGAIDDCRTWLRRYVDIGEGESG